MAPGAVLLTSLTPVGPHDRPGRRKHNDPLYRQGCRRARPPHSMPHISWESRIRTFCEQIWRPLLQDEIGLACLTEFCVARAVMEVTLGLL